MNDDKIRNMLEITARNLTRKQIPFAIIGAMALAFYGLPRFTSDIDLIIEGKAWSELKLIMGKLGYTCYQKTDNFAQFESELGVMGYIDFMFVNTRDGINILNRRIVVEDEVLGKYPVVQPTDYIILKMLAIANNPERGLKDEADIAAFMKLWQKGLLSESFEPIEKKRIYQFSKRFGLKKLIEKYFMRKKNDTDRNRCFEL